MCRNHEKVGDRQMRLARIAEVYAKALRSVITFPAILAGIVLLGLMLLTTADVLLRYFFNRPIVGCVEISVSLMICIGFLGQAWCALERRHIRVDLFVENLSPKTQSVIDIFNYLIVAGLSALIALESFNQSLVVQRLGSVSELLRIPQPPFYLVIVASYILLLLATVTLLFHTISKVVTGKRDSHFEA